MLIHTGQHYDNIMSDIFFKELNIKKPDISIISGAGSHSEQTGKIMTGLEKEFMVRAYPVRDQHGRYYEREAGHVDGSAIDIGGAVAVRQRADRGEIVRDELQRARPGVSDVIELAARGGAAAVEALRGSTGEVDRSAVVCERAAGLGPVARDIEGAGDCRGGQSAAG